MTEEGLKESNCKTTLLSVNSGMNILGTIIDGERTCIF